MRVNEKELDTNIDGRICFSGAPFSGTAFELAESGKVLSEWAYVDGFKGGTSSVWFCSGPLRRTVSYYKGAFHGPYREWFEDGKLREIAEYEFGICKRKQKWNEKGNLVEDYTLPEDYSNVNYQIIVLQREIEMKYSTQ